MRTTVPLEELLKAHYVVEELKAFIADRKQQLLTDMIEADCRLDDFIAFRSALKMLREVERTMEHASYEAVISYQQQQEEV